jgi:hypothetical protein
MTGILAAGAVAVFAACLVPAGTAHAQGRLKLKGSAVGNPASTPTAPAGAYTPQLLRNQLLSIHGFTRAGLASAGTDVPSILRGFIADAGEPVIVRRQAVKALALYPTDGNFSFIRQNLAGAALPIRRLYVTALRGFAGDKADEITEMLPELLAGPERSMRHAAVGLAGALAPSPRLRAVLRARLEREPEPGVQKEIRRLLTR